MLTRHPSGRPNPRAGRASNHRAWCRSPAIPPGYGPHRPSRVGTRERPQRLGLPIRGSSQRSQSSAASRTGMRSRTGATTSMAPVVIGVQDSTGSPPFDNVSHSRQRQTGSVPLGEGVGPFPGALCAGAVGDGLSGHFPIQPSSFSLLITLGCHIRRTPVLPCAKNLGQEIKVRLRSLATGFFTTDSDTAGDKYLRRNRAI